MAIAHVATEYVFSDFLLKDPSSTRSQNIRTELAMDKMVTCVAVGLPLLLISLAFAQEVSVGTQISCFAPSNFSWRQAAYVDSYCWASVHTHTSHLWLHKFFPYILLLVAVLMYTPALFWRFTAAPLLQSDLGFIMEELDRCYNRAVTLAKRMASNDLPSADSDNWTDGCFMYPLVEKYLVTKRFSRGLLVRYLLCRGATLVILLCACVYLGYYLRLAALDDEFGCSLRTGLLLEDPTVPEKVQCKLIAVGVFSLLCLVNLVLFTALVPAVIYAGLRPLFCLGKATFLDIYQCLPTVSVLPRPGGQWDDLAMYLLFLEENLSELKSYKYIKDFDSMGLLQTLCLVKTDTMDGRKAPRRADKQADPGSVSPNGSPGVSGPTNATASTVKPSGEGPKSASLADGKGQETEMMEFTPLLPADSHVIGDIQ
ncbi:hypothetical protein NHX12_008208 [Muraenolepis orangiensis]|uniref:Pannexin n=1 Tax=Muraenolepis orangiensis TaxID=630683 RepID=A0A9Q0DJC0_9TELE|nr:hypothetical protein NHX12_008208 [Muraenolepis orangiensis]